MHESDLNRGHGVSYFSSFCWFWGCCPTHLLIFKIEQLPAILKAFLYINHFPCGSGVWSTCSHVSFSLHAEHSFRCNRSKTLSGAVVQKTYLNIGIYKHILHYLERSRVVCQNSHQVTLGWHILNVAAWLLISSSNGKEKFQSKPGSVLWGDFTLMKST